MNVPFGRKIKSGRYQGKTWEQVMFIDYRHIVYVLSRRKKESQKYDGRKDEFHLYLEELVKKGEKLPIRTICPICQAEPIEFFSVLGDRYRGYSMSMLFSSCGQSDCKKKIENMAIDHSPVWLRARFSSVMCFRLKHDQNQFIKLLRQAMKLPEKLTEKAAYEVFNRKISTPIEQEGKTPTDKIIRHAAVVVDTPERDWPMVIHVQVLGYSEETALELAAKVIEKEYPRIAKAIIDKERTEVFWELLPAQSAPATN